MKLVFFNDFTLGVLKDGNVIDVFDAVKDVPHMTPQELISGVIADFMCLSLCGYMYLQVAYS